MEYSCVIRRAGTTDLAAIYSILSEVAGLVPIDLSTQDRVDQVQNQIIGSCLGGLSYVAVDENGLVVGFQLAQRKRWFEEWYIHLTYAAVTAAAQGKGVFKRLIEIERRHGLPLVAVVKPGNKSDTANRLKLYNFRPYSDGPHEHAYRWDP